MTDLKKNKVFSLLVFSLFYIMAYAVGIWTIRFFTASFFCGEILQVFIFDLTATIAIWIFSLFIKNSSLYDAYWSLTPLLISLYLIYINNETSSVWHWIFTACFLIWAIRLTANWVVTFDNMEWEDWRYRKFRELPAPLWHLANFFGIMIMPTLFVFAGMVPYFFFLTGSADSHTLFGCILVLLGTGLEFFADRQMHASLKEQAESGVKTVCQKGLWKYSRHPNYLGEITVWFGVFVALVLNSPEYWWTCFGFLIMVFLFTVISIPMMERRQLQRRPEYADYKKETSALLLLPRWRKGGG